MNGEAVPTPYEIIERIAVKCDMDNLRQIVPSIFSFGSYPSNIIHILFKTQNYISFLEKDYLQEN
jgi:hypothetical protein